ncbi:uncharacterized protein LOC110236326 [Exaiptasia diaphana]|uniref:RING-type domain-containing protein n=1 Tax=Exaiptasia diaphana TaxID=2652724 RepID=A0A913X1L5_EXADI|nr:uncharacterized protein LOC110236326 [Exaiptasia diaphana]KXJ16073.1 hypothetical protein AC249_AIPGENE19825 [Exaiptasia diaphana]
MSVYGRKIQGKSSKKQDIEETSNKLRAIKQRQGQWMREREEAKALSSSKSLDSLASRGKSTSTRSYSNSELSSSPEFRGGGSKGPFSNPRRKPLYTPPKRDKSNVITWSGHDTGKLGRPPSAQGKQPSSSQVPSRSHRLKEKTYEPSNYSSSKLNSKPNLLHDSEMLKLHSERHKEVDGESFDIDNKSDSDEEIDSRLPKDLDHDMINALAESVAKKLNTKVNTRIDDRKSAPRKNQEDDQEMSTHMCPLCHTLMSGTRHTPMALIPCGHTLCKECLKDCNKCPSCQSRVSSSAENTVLKQIISDFLSQKERKRLEKLEQETRKYVDEYQSLSVRSNALAEEADIILNGMEDLTEQLFQEKKVFKRLEVDNEELTRKISELENQRDKNKLKLNESRERSENLESNYEDQKQRLSLVEDTIKTITQSKERVKMMVHNFAPSFNLDQFD